MGAASRARRWARAVASLLVILGAGPAARGQAFDWRRATPESRGLSSARLDRLKDDLAARKTRAFLVIRDDRIVYEWYADGHDAAKPHSTASLAKALVAGLSLGVALTDGRLGLDDKAAEYVPSWRNDRRKAAITLRQLGSHTSGLEDAEADGLPHDKLTGWKGDFWKRLDPPDDPFTIARDRTPTLGDPGGEFRYSNPGIAVLSFAVTAALKDTPQKDIRTLLRDRVMRPIGVPDGEWSVGYGKTTTADGLPLVASWGGGNYTARAVARVGRLMLREGDWDGEPLLGKGAVRALTADAGTPGHGGIGWWSNNGGNYAKLPRDAFWGSGAGHQVLLVVPSLDLIAVRNGASLSDVAEHHDALNAHLFGPLLAAITAAAPVEGSRNRAPYPPSPVIARIDWAETVARSAFGSDNWPITWGDDGHLYTAYGDGDGFTLKRSRKLSLGLARIEGGPDDSRGVNIPAATLEQRGDGKAGVKASGLLAVDGVLYLWARNAGNSKLAWSADRGSTWTWADWTFATSFGCPTFLNFGRDYAGARDAFVYAYSHDRDSAYEAADRMVLARVPQDRIRERDAYEFFKALDAGGRPAWSKEVADRGAVFTHEGKCYRSGITYNAALKRYLWCQTLPGADPRVEGGFGVYDAPEPWGPWTTAFFTEAWDVGPGETSSFPAKWMSDDGATLHLVFSGDDAFSVRRATLTLHAPGPPRGGGR